VYWARRWGSCRSGQTENRLLHAPRHIDRYVRGRRLEFSLGWWRESGVCGGRGYRRSCSKPPATPPRARLLKQAACMWHTGAIAPPQAQPCSSFSLSHSLALTHTLLVSLSLGVVLSKQNATYATSSTRATFLFLVGRQPAAWLHSHWPNKIKRVCVDTLITLIVRVAIGYNIFCVLPCPRRA
jgi:hypothetical protein